jgi:hypothetical protein
VGLSIGGLYLEGRGLIVWRLQYMYQEFYLYVRQKEQITVFYDLLLQFPVLAKSITLLFVTHLGITNSMWES